MKITEFVVSRLPNKIFVKNTILKGRKLLSGLNKTFCKK